MSLAKKFCHLRIDADVFDGGRPPTLRL
jgi:hypothetical protein